MASEAEEKINLINLKRFLQLNIEDLSIFTILDAEKNKIFTGNAIGFFDMCFEKCFYLKYFDWYVTDFSDTEIYISENSAFAKRTD